MFVVCMMLKNEAETIGETFRSVQEVLGSTLRGIVVHDTGSTDTTTDRCIEAYGATHSRMVPWVDFSANRNALLDDAALYAEPDDVLLMLDAGTVLRGVPVLLGNKARPTAWNVIVKLGTITYKRPQVFAVGKGWKYAGSVHEAAIPPAFTAEGAAPVADSGLLVDYCLRDDARPERWQRDLALLEDDYSPRGRFYYAQTLELLGERARAFFWYLHRAARTDGWYQEQCMAYIRAIPLAPTLAIAQWCAAQAAVLDPTRGEAWLQMAIYQASCASGPRDWMIVHNDASEALERVPGPDALFVDQSREWMAQELCARAVFYQGNKMLARQLWSQILPDVPDYAQNQIRENLRFCDE